MDHFPPPLIMTAMPMATNSRWYSKPSLFWFPNQFIENLREHGIRLRLPDDFALDSPFCL